MSAVKKACICSVCVALCYVLPMAFHAVGAGKMFSPMHIPVLLCGLICGPIYGLFCGAVGPIISSLLSGMPPVNSLFSMVPELCTYGLCCGILLRVIHTKSTYGDLYCAMVPALLLGRIIGGVAKSLFYMATGTGVFSMSIWATSYFLETLPGTILQLLVIPTLVFTLMRAKLIPSRYAAIQMQEVVE